MQTGPRLDSGIQTQSIAREESGGRVDDLDNESVFIPVVLADLLTNSPSSVWHPDCPMRMSFIEALRKEARA